MVIHTVIYVWITNVRTALPTITVLLHHVLLMYPQTLATDKPVFVTSLITDVEETSIYHAHYVTTHVLLVTHQR